MANTLTAIAPQAYSAAYVVSKEPSAALDSINMDFDDKGVAKGDSVKVPVAPAASTSDYSPAMTTSAGTDKTAESVSVSIDYSKETTWNLTAEQMRSLENADTDKEWVSQLLQQGMRALRNEAEEKLCQTIYKGAGAAYGTAATTPFASTLEPITNAYKILKENGAPMSDLQMIVNPTAGLNLRNLGIIQQAYQAGSDAERRSGNFLRQFGFMINESSGIATHTAGTATGFDAAGGEPLKETTIAVDGSDSGTILAGDVVTFAGDTNKYVVVSSTASGAASGNIVINKPGLKKVLADTVEGTLAASYTANLAFEKSAIVGVMRPPLMFPNANISQLLISDEKGLTYLLCEIAGDGMKTWSLRLAYGFKVIQPEHIVTILG